MMVAGPAINEHAVSAPDTACWGGVLKGDAGVPRFELLDKFDALPLDDASFDRVVADVAVLASSLETEVDPGYAVPRSSLKPGG